MRDKHDNSEADINETDSCCNTDLVVLSAGVELANKLAELEEVRKQPQGVMWIRLKSL